MFVYVIYGLEHRGDDKNTGIPYYGRYFGIGMMPIPSPFILGIGYR